MACPTSGNRHCMAGYDFFECGEVMCGYSGLTFYGDRIELPDEDSGSMTHESIHWVLYQMGDSHYADHSHPAFEACR